jgi:hypothetical protein
MAMKRSRRGQRIVSARQAAQWDEERIRRFKEEQRRKRQWISFVEIAEWYSGLEVPTNPKKAAAAAEQAYRMLQTDLLAGLFEEGGRSLVLFRFPGVNFTAGKMTRQGLQAAIDDDPDGEHVRLLLMHCWLPRKLFERWCERHHLPKSPRFQPSQESSPGGAGRSPESSMPAPTLVPQPASKLVVDAVDQPKVPSGIQPREVPVPRPQDDSERRGLVAHTGSSPASDERSDLDTQPSKHSNKGGRPPTADWEALRNALVEEIKIAGYPDPRNPPGWRQTKDVVEWAYTKLGKQGKGVAPRTVADNVRRMLRELRARRA